MLSLGNSGAIVGLPEQYLPATLEIELSTDATATAVEKIQIEIAKNKLSLPQCIMQLLKTNNASDISLSASWYHEASSLPHYINVNFYDPGYNPEKWANSGYSIIFNLANAKIIDMTYSQVSPDGSSSQLHPVNFSSLCRNQEIENFLDATPTP
ncbi:hypothetical protein IB234_23735 [Pseudomonas sp. PDM16]|uniref:hypothetical protein n=1 Tax=Pseudomonas sp. PDM16 TaxID=2769292 RepID=UPI00177A9044|nr:hypothetical protein [Pseudomonas sp. PDM16]MBD9417580.1 hypothetical protein [Pseudomonas sp. PDM16]